MQQAMHVQIEILKGDINICTKTCNDNHCGSYGPKGLPKNLKAYKSVLTGEVFIHILKVSQMLDRLQAEVEIYFKN